MPWLQKCMIFSRMSAQLPPGLSAGLRGCCSICAPRRGGAQFAERRRRASFVDLSDPRLRMRAVNGVLSEQALNDFQERIRKYEDVYETITDRNLHYIKLIDMCGLLLHGGDHIFLPPLSVSWPSWCGRLYKISAVCARHFQGC